MRPIDSQAKIREAVPALDAELMMGKLKEYSRFGLPGASSSDGRGGEPPLPLLGRMDRSILLARREYEQNLSHAALALDAALRLQRAFCEPRDTDSEKDSKLADEKPGRPCSNIWCDHVCTGIQNDRLREGRCPTCAQYWRRNGVERDPRPRDDVAPNATRGDAA